MEWIESKIKTNKESIEFISAQLIENNVGGFQVEDDAELREFIENREASWDYVEEELLERNREEVYITFYVTKNGYGIEMLNAVKSSLNSLKTLDLDNYTYELSSTEVDEEDWVNNWKKYYKPFKIDNIVIKPTWEEYEPTGDEKILQIDPGHVFGTGLHHSTSMCIKQAQKFVKFNDEILDLGCGSGILSITGMLLDAKNAISVDIDENAEAVALGNAGLNNINLDNYKVLTGNILTDDELVSKITNNKYNIVFANIVADVIIGISDFVLDAIEADGYYIMSGIIDDRENDVKEKLQQLNFNVVETLYQEGWVCIVAQKAK